MQLQCRLRACQGFCTDPLCALHSCSSDEACPSWTPGPVVLLWPFGLCDSQLDAESGKGHMVAKARWLFLNPIPSCCQPALKYNPSLTVIDVFELGNSALEKQRREIEYQPSLLPQRGSVVARGDDSLENGVTAQISTGRAWGTGAFRAGCSLQSSDDLGQSPMTPSASPLLTPAQLGNLGSGSLAKR